MPEYPNTENAGPKGSAFPRETRDDLGRVVACEHGFTRVCGMCDPFVASRTDQARVARSSETTRPEVYDIARLASLLGVTPAHIRVWKMRGRVPEPDFYVAGHPAWWSDSIADWLEEIGRISKPPAST